MKRLWWLACFLLPLRSFSFVDYIHDDYREEKTASLHSYGLMVYGGHNNTFHLRQFFFRYNHQLDDSVQFFATLSGQKDTHDPAIDYPFVLGNVSLYDYGVTLTFWDRFFVSPRGAATYRENYHTYLLVPPYFYASNVAEFDSPSQYVPIFYTGPGIRFGYRDERLEIGYSQGDFRHSIPIAFMAKYRFDGWYVRGLFQLKNEDPLVYLDSLWRATGQISVGGEVPYGKVVLGGILEVSRLRDDWWGRAEQAVTYRKATLALREIWREGEALLFEGSVQYNFFDHVRAGIFAGSDSRFYAATQVGF